MGTKKGLTHVRPCFLLVRRLSVCYRLLSNNSFFNSLNSLGSGGVNNFESGVNNLFYYAVNYLSERINGLSSSGLVTTRSERHSCDSYEHKCNLFHFLFCFLKL